MRDSSEPGLIFHPSARPIVHFGPFRADLSDGSLSKGLEEVRLPPRALALLLYLVERPGRVVSKDALIDAVWKDAHVSETSLTEAIGIIRQTLGDSAQQPQYIQTVHRRGYRFVATVSTAPDTTTPIQKKLEPAATIEVQPEPDPVRAGIPRSPIVWAVSIAAAGAAIAGLLWYRSAAAANAAPVTRATITLPAEQAPAPALSAHTVMALAPDGQTMVYVAGTSGRYQLYARRMDQFEARPIAGTAGGHGPFFSPDGRRVAFFADGQLKHVSLDGGEPLTIAESPAGLGGFWTTDRTILFAPRTNGGLWEVDERGGAAREIAPAPKPAIGYRWPQQLPDGDTILATRRTLDDGGTAVVALSRSRGSATTLAEGATYGRFMLDGTLLFLRGAALQAATFTPGDEQIGPERPVVERVMVGSSGAAQFSLSSSGSLIYISDDPARQNRALVAVDRTGASVVRHDSRAYQNVSLCGDRLATTIAEGGRSDLWVAPIRGGAFTRLTTSGGVIEPVWRPGCDEIAYAVNQKIYLQRADGSAAPMLLLSSTLPQAPASWSPDGARIIYVEVHPETGADLWVLNIADGRRTPLIVTPNGELGARVSPDGRWLAYQAVEKGRSEVRIRPYAAAGAGSQISRRGGAAPAWSADGRLLHFRNESGIASVPVDASRGPELAAEPRVLKRPDLVLFRPLDAADHFLIVERQREHLPLTTLNLVVNWKAEVRDRLDR